MTCTEVQAELVAYHFGLVTEESRVRVEAHLLECSECLRSFLALKREIETSPTGPLPSPQARSRLRNAVRSELESRRIRRPWSWWERPLAFACAATALVLATISMRALTSLPGAPPHSRPELVDPASGVEPR